MSTTKARLVVTLRQVIEYKGMGYDRIEVEFGTQAHKAMLLGPGGGKRIGLMGVYCTGCEIVAPPEPGSVRVDLTVDQLSRALVALRACEAGELQGAPDLVDVIGALQGRKTVGTGDGAQTEVEWLLRQMRNRDLDAIRNIGKTYPQGTDDEMTDWDGIRGKAGEHRGIPNKWVYCFVSAKHTEEAWMAAFRAEAARHDAEIVVLGEQVYVTWDKE